MPSSIEVPEHPGRRVLRVLIAASMDPSADPRTRRVIEEWSSRGHDVTVVGEESRELLSCATQVVVRKNQILGGIIRKIAIILRGLASLHKRGIGIAHRLNNFSMGLRSDFLRGPKNFDLGIVQSLESADFVFARCTNVIFDLQDVYVRQFEHSAQFRIFLRPYYTATLNQYLPQAASSSVTSQGHAAAYGEDFGIDPIVVWSTPRYVDLKISDVRADAVRAVHHGLASPNRKLEVIIDAVLQSDSRVTLDLYLVGNLPYQQRLRRRARQSKRIRFMPPVGFTEIIPMLNNYDVGVAFFVPTTYNLLHCVPNKFWEFVMARLAIVSGPSPDMAAIIRTHKIGQVSTSFTARSLSRALSALDYTLLTEFKQNADNLSTTHCAEVQLREWCRHVEKIFR